MLQATTDEFTPAALATITAPFKRRTQLLDGPSARVESLSCASVRPEHGTESFSPEFQVALPYRGIFVWHVGADDVVGDATQVLFVRGDEAFRTSHPLPAGYAELIITPAIDVLSEIANAEGVHLRAHPLFRYRSRRCPPELQTLRRAAAGALSRARWYRLEAHLGHSIRLADAARAVGASPAYLTHVFRRFEGASLHQYLIHLRLVRALAELRHADDLTSLALDLGFSSHSHFSAEFRRRYGLTPSQFRDGTINRTPDASAAGASGVEEMQP